MKKQLKALILILALVFLAGCSSNGSTKTDQKKKEEAVNEKAVQEENPAVEPKKEQDKKEEDSKTNKLEQLKKDFNVDKYFVDIGANNENRKFSYEKAYSSYIKNGDIDEAGNSKTTVAYDGEQYAEVVVNDKSKGQSSTYVDVTEKEKVTYMCAKDKNNKTLMLNKLTSPSLNTKEGINLQINQEKWPHKWKLDEKASKGNLLVYYDELKDKDLNAYKSSPGFVFSDSKGFEKMVFTYDIDKEQMQSLTIETQLEGQLKIEGNQDTPGLKDGPITLKEKKIYKNFVFDDVKDVKIPDEVVKNAKEISIGAPSGFTPSGPEVKQ